MRIARFIPLVLVLAVASCGSDPTSITTIATPSPSPSILAMTMPSARLPGLRHRDATLSAVDASLDATHPDTMTQALSDAGLVAVRDRTYTGARGTFARVVIRGWVFSTADGASSFQEWLQTNASEELLGGAKPLSASGDVLFLRHAISGCCHEETPIYLAVWQRGQIVWTVRASGPRIRTGPVLTLVRSIEQEV